MANDIIQTDLAFETTQQMVELQPPLFLSTNNLEQHVEDKVAIDIREIIQGCGDGLLLQACCIYKVPILIHPLKEEAYTPQVVSIGPFHYGNERLQDMERHKQILFKRFIQRAMSSLDDLVCCVKDLEPKVRASYSETINLTKEELVKLTLIDAGFIIELFMMSTNEKDKDAKLSQEWLEFSIVQDLLLLENQLPFFVIEELFNKAFPHDCHSSLHNSFLWLTYEYFKDFNKQELKPNVDVKVKHFTDLLRLFHLQGEMVERHILSLDRSLLSYNANTLQEAGIKLKASMSKCLLDLKFSGHIFKIPQISIQDSTEVLFRNMIALEQCHYPHDAYIIDYVMVLDYLIDTYKDVDVLVHKKIVGNYLGDPNNVALLFNGLTKNVTQTTFNSAYHDICKNLNGYCQGRWHKMKATLRRDYCRTPWQILVSIAAIILLVLTIVQTIFSILQVVK